MIEAPLAGFPYWVLGFHADNGPEYINHTVAKLLDKLRVEFTKSRPRRSNGLAETKNGAVVRKDLGYAHIPQPFASQVNAFRVRSATNPAVDTRSRVTCLAMSCRRKLWGDGVAVDGRSCRSRPPGTIATPAPLSAHSCRPGVTTT